MINYSKIILNGNKLKNFPIRLETRQRYFASPLHFTSYWKANEIGQGKEIKRYTVGVEDVKLPLFIDDATFDK